ncbi:hypothetical protein [Roseibium sp.]|uniref:hypothetical protein n=1 Tax=Roseibium sp. TaxID=1936156 RepID=UPI0039192BC7
MKLRDIAEMTGRTERTIRNHAKLAGLPTKCISTGNAVLLLTAYEMTLRGVRGQMLGDLMQQIRPDLEDLFMGENAKSFLVIMPDENKPGHFGFTCLPSAEAAVHLADTHAGSVLIPLHTVLRSALARLIEHGSGSALAQAMEAEGNA